jgi:hypothetical protein
VNDVQTLARCWRRCSDRDLMGCSGLIGTVQEGGIYTLRRSFETACRLIVHPASPQRRGYARPEITIGGIGVRRRRVRCQKSGEQGKNVGADMPRARKWAKERTRRSRLSKFSDFVNIPQLQRSAAPPCKPKPTALVAYRGESERDPEFSYKSFFLVLSILNIEAREPGK